MSSRQHMDTNLFEAWPGDQEVLEIAKTGAKRNLGGSLANFKDPMDTACVDCA